MIKLVQVAIAISAVAACGVAAHAATPAAASKAVLSRDAGTSLSYASQARVVGGSAYSYANPDVPGATGRDIVPGDRSTIDGDAMATEMQRTGFTR